MVGAAERAREGYVVLLIAVLAWVALLMAHGSHTAHDHDRGVLPAAWSLPSPWSLNEAVASPTSLALGWIVMLAAMMSPALVVPVRHIRQRSFKHRRWRSLTLFAAGYAAVWMVAGALLTALTIVIGMWIASSIVPAAGVGVVASIWQCSPIKQRCLNRCHAMADLPAFGAAADLGALRFGITHGTWCVGSCWALMLWTMSLPMGQMAAMALATLLIVSERLDAPGPARWQLRRAGRGPRLLLAQARLRWAKLA